MQTLATWAIALNTFQDLMIDNVILRQSTVIPKFLVQLRDSLSRVIDLFGVIPVFLSFSVDI